MKIVRLDANGTELSRFRTRDGYNYVLVMGPTGVLDTTIASVHSDSGYDLIAMSRRGGFGSN